jgi:nitrite reductase/ring-hydroxylating ferredoxin subunit
MERAVAAVRLGHLKVALVICVGFFTFYNDYIIPPLFGKGRTPWKRPNGTFGQYSLERKLSQEKKMSSFLSLVCRRRKSTIVRLLPPILEQRLKPGSAVEHTVPVPDQSNSVRLLNIIVVRDASGGTHAFENYCPHQAGRLFMEPGGTLQCRLHGAKFDVQRSGHCTSGPCVGERLTSLPLIEATHGDEGLSVSLLALLRLQETGSGGRPPPKGWQPNGLAKALLEAFEERSHPAKS